MQIGRGLPVEIEYAVETESYVLNSCVAQRGKHDRSHADLLGGFPFVFKVGRFFGDYIESLFHRLVQYVCKPHGIALARAHAAFFERHHAVSHVHHVLRPVKAGKLQNLENLSEMEILLISDDVETFVKTVGILAIQRGGKVARGVKRRAVRLYQQAGGHAVFFKLHDKRALGHFRKSLLF